MTVVSGFPSKNHRQLPNYHAINIPFDQSKAGLESKLKDTLQYPEKAKTSWLSFIGPMITITNDRSVNMLLHPKMHELVNSGQKFDLMIFGWFLNDFLLGIGAQFKYLTAVIITTNAIKSETETMWEIRQQYLVCHLLCAVICFLSIRISVHKLSELFHL